MGKAGAMGRTGTKRAMSTLRGQKGPKIADMVESAQFGYSWHARRGLEARFEW